MALINNVTLNPATFSMDAGMRLRSSQLTTLFDGKELNKENTLIFDNQGTGTGTFGANKYNMSVTSGQYFIRQGRRFSPYFSGKSQMVECTFDNFIQQANIVKRVGYFSSNAVAPFDSNKDGFWLESGNGTYTLKASRNGTETLSLDWTLWDGYAQISSYNWANFTVIAFDYLWLGGAVMRLFLKTPLGFVLCHTFNYAGTSTDVFILSPNQPVRYEIRSTTGTGSFRYICSQVSTEGSINEEGFSGSINTGHVAISFGVIGTKYPLIAMRKQVASRDVAVKLTDINLFVSSTSDQILWTLELNPTLSAPLTYADVALTNIQRAVGNGTITVSSAGKILSSGYLVQNGILPSDLFNANYLAYLGSSLTNTMDEIILCGTPITTTVGCFGALRLREYAN